jgi:peroxiredoxin
VQDSIVENGHNKSKLRWPYVIGAVVVLVSLVAGGWWLASARWESPPPATAADDNEVLAVVNGHQITRADLEKQVALEEVMYYMVTKEKLPGSDRATVLIRLINQELLLEEAAKEEITFEDEEVTKRIEEVRDAAKLSEEDLEEQLTRLGLSMDDLHEAFRQVMITNSLLKAREEELGKSGTLQWLRELRDRAEVEIKRDFSAEVAPKVGAQAPDFTLNDLNGQEVTLSDFRGQPVLINFWATWCPPCRIEKPFLEKAYEKHKGEGFVILGVNMRESEETVRAFVNESGTTFPVLLDGSGFVIRLYKVYAAPTSFFVDKEGIIIDKHMGPLSQKGIEARLEKMR